jgi:hypothetical protein
MAGRHDTPTVDLGAVGARQHAVQGEAQILGPRQRLALMSRSLQATHDAERIAYPERRIAARMLNVQTGNATGGPVSPQIAVAPAGATDAMGEHDERDARARRDTRRPMQACRHVPRTRGVGPVEINERGRGWLRSRRLCRSRGGDRDGKQHGTEAPSRHVARSIFAGRSGDAIPIAPCPITPCPRSDRKRREAVSLPTLPSIDTP